MFKNTNEIIDKFISTEEDVKTDYLKRENSNFIQSLALLRKNIHNKAENDYLMTEVFPKELVDAFDEGYVYIHDKQLSPYCVSISCLDIATKGIPTTAKNMLASKPTKRLRKLLRHFSNVVVLMSQNVSGAVMLAQMTTIIASYLQYEEEVRGIKWTEEELREEMQSLIWELNMPLRSGSESAFTNVTLEFGKASSEIEDKPVIIGGEAMEYKYKDIPEEYFNRVNRAFIDVMAQGTGTPIPFTFPLISIPIDDNFDFENEMFLYILDKMYQWGGCYFENFRTKPFEKDYYKKLNPYIKARDMSVSRSLCCRLFVDASLLSKLGSGLFGSSTGSTGAVQVLNLNMNRLLMEFGHDKELLFVKIREYMELMQEGHQAKRKWILEHPQLYPTFFAFNDSLDNYFNVFAVTGMHEGLINIGYEEGIRGEGKYLAHEIMQYISEIINEFIVHDKVACGIEYAPAESAAIKLARQDVKWAKENNRDIFVQGSGDDVYLTSGCMLPFSDDDFLAQVENNAEFQAYATSGSIFHNFIETKLPPQKLAEYIDKLFTKPINYITLTPTLSGCMSCNQKFVGEDGKNIKVCPNCGSDDIVTFSRVIGYVKAISRKDLHETEQGKYEGEYNFWSNARRIDWNSRVRTTEKQIEEVLDDEILQKDN